MIGDHVYTDAPGLILLAPGAPDPRWEKPYFNLRDRVAKTLGKDRAFLAFLMHGNPTLLEASLQAYNANLTEVVILPLFLSLTGEIEFEIPKQVVRVKEKLLQMSFRLLPPIGEHPSMLDEIYFTALKAVTVKTDG